MILTLSDVDLAADKADNAEMQGWELVLFDPRKDGFTNKHGVFRDGKWQVAHRISPNQFGIWRVPKNLERLLRVKGRKSQ